MEQPHLYGPRLHLIGDPYLLTLLARIGSPETPTDALPTLVRSAYRVLFSAALSGEFPAPDARVATRMTATEPRAFYEGPRLCPQTRLVVCAVIRAGLLPAQICYEAACEVLPAANVRLDFLNLSRVTDDNGNVTGVRLDGSKIGGPVEDAVVVIPDPMAATGGTLERACRVYEDLGPPPRSMTALHLMVTPEAVQRLARTCPELITYAGRLDRGLSPEDVLATVPGTHPDRERGLNDVQYIVPGAGGMGELLTNAWV